MAEDALRVTFGADISGSEEQIKKDLKVILGNIEGSEESKITLGAKLGSDAATELQKQLSSSELNIEVGINSSEKTVSKTVQDINKIAQAEKSVQKAKEKTLIISENEIEKAEEILFLAKEYKKARQEISRLEKINPAKWTEQNDKERNKAYKVQTDNGKLAKELLGEITDIGYNVSPKSNHPDNVVKAIEQWATTVTDIGIGVEVTPNLVVNKAELLKEATQVTTEIKETVANTADKTSTTSSAPIATPTQNNKPIVQSIALEVSEESANKIVTDVTAIVRQLETDVTTKMAFGISEESAMQIRADIENATQGITVDIAANVSQTPQTEQNVNTDNEQIQQNLENAAKHINESTQDIGNAADEFAEISRKTREHIYRDDDGNIASRTTTTTTNRNATGITQTVTNADDATDIITDNAAINRQLESITEKLRSIEITRSRINATDLQIADPELQTQLDVVLGDIRTIQTAIQTGAFRDTDGVLEDLDVTDSVSGITKINVLLKEANNLISGIRRSSAQNARAAENENSAQITRLDTIASKLEEVNFRFGRMNVKDFDYADNNLKQEFSDVYDEIILVQSAIESGNFDGLDFDNSISGATRLKVLFTEISKILSTIESTAKSTRKSQLDSAEKSLNQLTSSISKKLKIDDFSFDIAFSELESGGKHLKDLVPEETWNNLVAINKQMDDLRQSMIDSEDLDANAESLNKINVLLSKANGIVKEIEDSVKKTTVFQDNIDNATTKVADLRNKASKIAPDANLNNQLNQLQNLAEYLGGKGWGDINVYGNAPESLEDARIAYTKLAAEIRNTIALKTSEQAAEARSANIRTQSNKILKEATNYYEQHQSGIGKNAALQAKWNALIDKFKSGSFNGDLKAMRAELAELQTETKAAGAETDALWFQLKKLFTDHFGALVATAVLGNAKQVFADMYQRVVEIDTAMTELKKVTNLTAAEYKKFGETAEQAAKKVGGSIADTITSTADFARLDYDIADASSLAQAALVYKNVGDGLEDVNEASQSIISTMKGFGIEASEAMSIVDKFNTTGNKFAISSQGVGEALRRSAASLNAAGNSLEESIALVTVGNNVIQDPDSVGKSLPNNVVIRCKLATISVKSWRQLRPRKDFVIYNKSDFAKFDICNRIAA